MKPAPAFLILAALTAAAHGQTDWLVRTSGTTERLVSVAYGAGVFLASSQYNVVSSGDGVTWTKPEWPESEGRRSELTGVHYGDGRFMVFAEGNIWFSADGASLSEGHMGGVWTNDGLTAATLNGVTVVSRCYSYGLNAAVPGRIASGAQTLEPVAGFPSSERVEWVMAAGDEFLAGSGQAIFASTDGLAWTLRSRTSLDRAPVMNDGALYQDGTKSEDAGRTWTYINGGGWPHVHAAGGFVSLSGDRIRTSPDAVNWTDRESGTTDALNAITFGNNTFVAVGDGGRIVTSAAANPLPPAAAPGVEVVESLTLKWTSESGRWYAVESSADMTRWTRTGERMPGTGVLMTRAFERTAARAFFRVTVE